MNGTYNAFQYNKRATDIIKAHDASTPLFLYNAWQEAHTPNEVRTLDASAVFFVRRTASSVAVDRIVIAFGGRQSTKH